MTNDNQMNNDVDGYYEDRKWNKGVKWYSIRISKTIYQKFIRFCFLNKIDQQTLRVRLWGIYMVRGSPSIYIIIRLVGWFVTLSRNRSINHHSSDLFFPIFVKDPFYQENVDKR